jgi:hypothetical protein
MKLFEIWMEGYKITGDESQARLLDKIEAETFEDAVEKYAYKYDNNVDFDRYGKKRHAIWGCELFDNSVDARKSFG